MSRPFKVALWTLWIGSGLPVMPAQADQDYDPSSDSWNGMSTLVALGHEQVNLTIPARLDLHELQANDALLLVYPTEGLPISSLTRFVREGGRLAVADDFGEGEELLSVYRIARRTVDVVGTAHFRGNHNLPLARAQISHPLTMGADAVVANHPTVLGHAHLEPVFAFGPGEALVLAGAVGEGRFVALGDPSLFINNMLHFVGNRQLASNLLRYLEGDDGGRIFLVTTETTIVGRYGEAEGAGGALDTWLQSIAHTDLPPTAVLLLALTLAAVLLFSAVSALPKKSPYEGRAMFPRPAQAGGFVGRVAFFLRQPSDLLQPLLAYKFELEGEVVRKLELSGRVLLKDVLSRLRAVGFDEKELDEVRSLFLALDEIRSREDLPKGPPRIGAHRFSELVKTGERLLHRIEERSRGARP